MIDRQVRKEGKEGRLKDKGAGKKYEYSIQPKAYRDENKIISSKLSTRYTKRKK